MELALTLGELDRYLAEIFHQIWDDFAIETLAADSITMRLAVADRHLRPGGTVSGPSMFALADVSVYAMVLARVGKRHLAVTTSASLDFMRRPAAGVDLLARGQLLKLGKTLAVGDVHLFSEGVRKPVARATMTYSIPPT